MFRQVIRFILERPLEARVARATHSGRGVRRRDRRAWNRTNERKPERESSQVAGSGTPELAGALSRANAADGWPGNVPLALLNSLVFTIGFASGQKNASEPDGDVASSQYVVPPTSVRLDAGLAEYNRETPSPVTAIGIVSRSEPRTPALSLRISKVSVNAVVD